MTPARVKDSRVEETAVMTATTDIAKGSLAMSARGRKPQPNMRPREVNTID